MNATTTIDRRTGGPEISLDGHPARGARGAQRVGGAVFKTEGGGTVGRWDGETVGEMERVLVEFNEALRVAFARGKGGRHE